MAVYTQVSAEALKRFLAGFDVGELVSAKGIAEGVENSNYLVDTSKGRFILTLYEKRVSGQDLPYFMALLDHLAAKGLPVPRAIRDRNGEAIHRLEGRPACLIEFLPGVSVSHPTPVQARAAGAALGRMHAALADFPLDRPNSMGYQSWELLFNSCSHELNLIAPGLYDDVDLALDDLMRDWECYFLPAATIHADLFPDNVLMMGDQVSGLIDFYFACTDVRAYDLAIMHTALAFDATGTVYTAAVGDALIAGYDETFGLGDAERAHFNLMATGACLRFFLSRAWDWLNTPADAMVTRKDPLAYWRRLKVYDPALAARMKTLA